MSVVTRTILASAMLLQPVLAFPDELAEKGREVLAKNQSSVVTVLLVIRQQLAMPGRASRDIEIKSEVTGTVLDETGLTLISLSESDPSSLMDTMRSNPGGMRMETEIRDVKILLADNTEVPAEIILRDKDLDMAFIRPIERLERPFAHVNLSDSGQVEVLDVVVALNRLGKVVRRAYTASLERIEAVVHKPRTFYVPGNDPTYTDLGSPAFTIEGKFVGVFLMRAIKSGTGRLRDNVATVLVPAADILEAVKQVPPFD